MRNVKLRISMEVLALVAAAFSSPALAVTSAECEKRVSVIVSCSYVFDEGSSTCSLKCKLDGGVIFTPPRPIPIVMPGTTPAGPGISGHTSDPKIPWASLSIPEKAELNGFRQFSRELGRKSPAAKVDWGVIAERAELDVYKKLAAEGVLGKEHFDISNPLEKKIRRGPLEMTGAGDKSASKAPR